MHKDADRQQREHGLCERGRGPRHALGDVPSQKPQFDQALAADLAQDHHSTRQASRAARWRRRTSSPCAQQFRAPAPPALGSRAFHTVYQDTGQGIFWGFSPDFTQSDADAGVAMGNDVADYVVDHYFLPRHR